ALTAVLLIGSFGGISTNPSHGLSGWGTAPSAAPPPTSSPRSQAVNPFQGYQSEPAPVGIADFGLGPGMTPYRYNTSTFVGNVSIQRLGLNGTAPGNGLIGLVNGTVANSTPVKAVGDTFLPADVLGMTIQENIVLWFVDGGVPYEYWIQNVAGLVPGSCTSSNPVVNFTNSFVGCTGIGTTNNDT
ncbi:thermopsin precursor, partial [mine drainage metagenome]